MVNVNSLNIDGVYEITPNSHVDDRGFFSETYNQKSLEKHGIDITFIQDNHSLSKHAGVLRGLHFQTNPFAQDKLVRVIRGAIYDVAVDIRPNSKTFGKWVGLTISEEKRNQILVPKGFAHGFVTLTENTEVIYKVSAPYSPECDRSIFYADLDIGIDWPCDLANVTTSEKDKNGLSLKEYLESGDLTN